jgi:hypothetical protein
MCTCGLHEQFPGRTVRAFFTRALDPFDGEAGVAEPTGR